MKSKTLLALAGLTLLLANPLAQSASPVDSVLNALTFRNIGPFRTAAWITQIAVPDAPAREHLYTIYAASRSGGLWKTSNNGVTWNAVSDSVGAAAVGAVAIAPSNSQVVWMGTGDQANARSSYSGKGVFKSTDAGATWQFMGLADSHHIARIVIHPDESRRRLRCGDGTPLLAKRRARRLSNDRRRQVVEESALRERRRRRDRPRDQPDDADDGLRGDV